MKIALCQTTVHKDWRKNVEYVEGLSTVAAYLSNLKQLYKLYSFFIFKKNQFYKLIKCGNIYYKVRVESVKGDINGRKRNKEKQ